MGFGDGASKQSESQSLGFFFFSGILSASLNCLITSGQNNHITSKERMGFRVLGSKERMRFSFLFLFL